MMSLTRIFLVCHLLLGVVSGWQFQPTSVASSSVSPVRSSSKPTFTRRSFLGHVPAAVAVVAVVTPAGADAITSDAAKDQWTRSVAVIDGMLQDWTTTYEKGGGDAIRVQLGTQGTTSPLFKIDKALRILREDADDLIEFTDLAEEFQLALSRADSMAYSANFTGGSGKPTPPAVYIEKSKKEVIDLQKIAKSISALL